MTRASTIVVVDDEPNIRHALRFVLEKEGFDVFEASNAAEGFELVTREAPDLVVLDVTMPGEDGISLCRRLQQKAPVPVLFLSSRTDEIDRIVGLEVGGDDYVAKPFSPREVVARIRAILRRVQKSQISDETLTFADVSFHPDALEVRVGGKVVDLSVTEFEILHVLFQRSRMVFSRARLLDACETSDLDASERQIDSHIKRIRAKFRAFDIDPIRTVYGRGYRAADLEKKHEG